MLSLLKGILLDQSDEIPTGSEKCDNYNTNAIVMVPFL